MKMHRKILMIAPTHLNHEEGSFFTKEKIVTMTPVIQKNQRAETIITGGACKGSLALILAGILIIK